MSHGASTTAPTTFGRNRRPRLGPPDEAARLPPDAQYFMTSSTVNDPYWFDPVYRSYRALSMYART